MMQYDARLQDERLKAAIAEMQQLISSAFPDTSFTTICQDDPAGIYLIATVNTKDIEAVIDCFIDRLLTLQVDEGLPLYVVPVRKSVKAAARPTITPFRRRAG